MSIRVLSDQTINKIAAGEVIENPASVVKELIENALDAEASSITIEIERGGFFLIRVSDDGCGMSPDDLLLSLERHATSKIQKAEDLLEVATMGFRGEALASIAAISKMRMVTAQQEMGRELLCSGGKILNIQGAARNRGTTIEVKNLFFNVPARKKFQKSSGIAQSEIKKLLTKFALANSQIRVKLIADGKELLDLLPGELKERCTGALGEGFLKGAFPIDFEKNRCTIKGYLGSSLDAKGNRLGQYLFVNGRAVVCFQISRAIYEGYGTRLSSRLHPTFVLQVTLPPEWIDVNVHPQKREIRLREEGVVQEMLRISTLKAFQGEKKDHSYPKMEWNIETPLTFQETPPTPSPTLDLQLMEEALPVLGLFDSYLIAHPTSSFHLPHDPPPYDGLLLIDLKGAMARILYERFLDEKMPPLQTLMIPITLEFNAVETDLLKHHLKEIQRMGIDLNLFGENTFMIDALSPEINEGKVNELLQQFIQVFDQNLAAKEKEKKLAFTVSSFAQSEKRGWTVLEGKQIVKQLLKTSSPYDCPKGKKTVVHLSHDALSRLFQKSS